MMKKKKQEKVYHIKKENPNSLGGKKNTYPSIPDESTGLCLCACLLTHHCVYMCVSVHTHTRLCVCVCVCSGRAVGESRECRCRRSRRSCVSLSVSRSPSAAKPASQPASEQAGGWVDGWADGWAVLPLV